MFEHVTRPLRALMVARSFNLSIVYAMKVLTLMDRLEAGQIDVLDFARAGLLLGEQHPEDYKRARELFVQKRSHN